MEKIVSLCKRRGFVYPGSEIYGGLNGTWDLGPLGTSLARNIKHEWWKSTVTQRDDVVGLDSSILHHPKVWEASGHIASFTDPLIECKKCHNRFRFGYDPITIYLDKEKGKYWICPTCHENNSGEPRDFNLMFKTSLGSVEETATELYLRPETAQGIFINFLNVINSTRVTIPFGIAQIGKGFRNEITTGNFLFRVREFEMMELEFFVKPGTDSEWFITWKQERLNWYLNLGVNKSKIKLVDLPKEEIAHYSKGTSEIWYDWPFMGWGELEGIANRGDYDLTQHSKHSGKYLVYDDYTPYVIEPSVGVGRAMLAFLVDAYSEVGDRVILKLHPRLAPHKVAVFSLVANKEELVQKAKSLYLSLKSQFPAVWDDRGNIGKRYYAQDEIGTPWCVTVDYQTLEDDTVTVRDRDTAQQERVSISQLDTYFAQKLK
ncbi:glycine--tRNA ligase [Candidatus Amesbacteria bacterium RIFCSPHIGHO2_01_FULL_48_32]|uniref:glycine--tRNA ligase n=1 Tax=Candidatus Amesbacteria bacterium RIFCSPLOWO2_01_FULL_48_25 TaxID=1797259 RepID=A0A1F4ZC86_9BACT|nr:MAG: glycine--tRNA ligase [Candidatus Amesbacteria bacterium RIFCSPHIGHO2_01_FULL_48_32]OGD03516.1 MAG: glycine--tRNA ligase [Candidatus Amesbacteria bacterium RIFCSPLOWO2_01_FULL_48_25]HJZ05788.1 glycine--tRNA ligase [Patescibacteria group bacterium]